MASVTMSPGGPAVPLWGRVTGRVPGAAPLVAVVVLTAVALFRHVHALDAGYWIDEGISVGISSHHLTAIPGVLRQDGSPPLYYLLLHLWMAAFGRSPTSTHALSALFATVAAPAAYWAIAPLSRSGGVVAAAIIALDPYVGLYADETRMYSLVLLLSLVVCGAFVRVLILRRERGAPLLAVALALLLYTHSWGAFLAASAGASWLALVAWGPQRRALLRTGGIAFGGALVLFAPWVPTLLYQAAHTAAPWSHRPRLNSLVTALDRMAAGLRPAYVLGALGLAGLVAALVRRDRPTRAAALAIAALAAGTLLGAWAYSRYGSPAWALRYLVVVLGPLALLVGIGAGRIPRVAPAMVLVVLAVAAFLWGARPTDATLRNKSNVAAAAARLDPMLPRGTLVFSTQPEQVPDLLHYLPAGMQFVTPLGRVPDAGVFDWRDALARLRSARYATVLGQAVLAMHRGERLLLVQPRFSHPDSPWTVGIRDIARRWGRRLRRDRLVRRIATVGARRGSSRSTVRETLWVRE
jgi:mannosyltransferase